MGLATFIGGIHPYEGKELSENKPVQVLINLSIQSCECLRIPISGPFNQL